MWKLELELGLMSAWKLGVEEGVDVGTGVVEAGVGLGVEFKKVIFAATGPVQAIPVLRTVIS